MSIASLDEIGGVPSNPTDLPFISIGELLRFQAAKYHDKPLLRFEDDPPLSYREFDRLVNRLANGLRERLGIQAGDHLCVMLPNCPEYLLIWVALSRLGCVCVAVNTDFRGVALQRILGESSARVIFTSAELATALTEIGTSRSKVEHVIWLDPDVAVDARPFAAARHHDYSSLISDNDAEPDQAGRYSDPCLHIYTSGTTGASKAVEMSQFYAVHLAGEYHYHLGYSEDDVLYSGYPMYHAETPICVFLGAVYSGASAVISRKFSVSRFWPTVRDRGVTATTLMGAVMTLLLKAPDAVDDASNPLRVVLAAPTPQGAPEFERRFGVTVLEGYGATECCMPVWDRAEEGHRPGSAGRPCEHHELVILDENDHELPANRLGEIAVRPRRPYTQMSSYYGNDAATVAATTNFWYHTGDLGLIDDDGFVHFKGRRTDSLRRRGENISAFEVEESLQVHPDVLEAAVFGVPSDLSEDDVKAVVVLRAGATLTAADLLRWCEKRMARFMIPRYLEFAEELPKSVTQKVQKAHLASSWKTERTFDSERGAYLAT